MFSLNRFNAPRHLLGGVSIGALAASMPRFPFGNYTLGAPVISQRKPHA